jgi:hypothetical protein
MIANRTVPAMVEVVSRATTKRPARTSTAFMRVPADRREALRFLGPVAALASDVLRRSGFWDLLQL